MDVRFCILPPPDQESEGQPVKDELTPLPVIPQDYRVAQGTRVAWAGFPAQVEACLGQPKRGYFEGVVSAFHDDSSHGQYVVDGHVARGVSGGPVWYWPDTLPGIQIAGIVSAYRRQESNRSRFSVFEPINPVRAYVVSHFKGERVED